MNDELRRVFMDALTARMTRVRGRMTDAEFGQLLADMVDVRERFAAIDRKSGARGPEMSPDEIRQRRD